MNHNSTEVAQTHVCARRENKHRHPFKLLSCPHLLKAQQEMGNQTYDKDCLRDSTWILPRCEKSCVYLLLGCGFDDLGHASTHPLTARVGPSSSHAAAESILPI